MKPTKPPKPAQVRCAVYTRKSTEEGLEKEFNSLDAQREAGEAYIKSQAGEGWVLHPAKYDDGGFTGGNIERPALKRLLRDIEAGLVDAVVVYKVDRLSRSLLDFARLMQLFDEKNISFVSVTQQLNTASSMGRLVLNVLLSFAQFEREIISERTRDKIAATRRKGKWTGGRPVLGYELDPHIRKLVVNPTEAERVRAIFALYRDRGSLLRVVDELAQRGWASKAWTTGQSHGGKAFTRTSLYTLLTNVLYTGRVRYKDKVHPGEHAGIVDAELLDAVQAGLARNGRTKQSRLELPYDALLQGILRCGPCGCAMTPTHTAKKGRAKYRYYVCTKAQKLGWKSCPSKSVPAGAVEDLVVKQVAAAGQNPAVVKAVLAQLPRGHRIDPADVETVLHRFAPVWSILTPQERVRVVQLLIERVDYDGAKGKVAVAFRPGGLRTLAKEWSTEEATS